MFSGSLRFLESDQNKITLHDIDSEILKQILNFIYTAEIQVCKQMKVKFLQWNLYVIWL